jgi:hypothetical protein
VQRNLLCSKSKMTRVDSEGFYSINQVPQTHKTQVSISTMTLFSRVKCVWILLLNTGGEIAGGEWDGRAFIVANWGGDGTERCKLRREVNLKAEFKNGQTIWMIE